MRLVWLPALALLFIAAPVAADGEAAAKLDMDDWTIGLVAGGTGLAALAAGAAYFLGVGGLRHVDAGNVLEHPLRKRIMDTVQDKPGMHLRELATRHETAVTNTQWHLRKLEMAGLVNTQKVSGRRLYYPTQGGIQTRATALQNAATRNPNAARIYEHIQGHAGCNQRSVVDALDMNPGTVRWHLRRLQDAGLVDAQPDGASVRYWSQDRPPRPRLRR